MNIYNWTSLLQPDENGRGKPTRAPKTFLTNHPQRQKLWDVLFYCSNSLPYLRSGIDDIVTRLEAIISSRPVAENRLTWSAPATPEISIPNLSHEIRREGSLPVTGGGFCDIWLGTRLGKQKVALKVLKMFGVPEQTRRVGFERLRSYAL